MPPFPRRPGNPFTYRTAFVRPGARLPLAMGYVCTGLHRAPRRPDRAPTRLPGSGMERQLIRPRAAGAAGTFRAVERLESRRLLHGGVIDPEAAPFEAFGLTAADVIAPTNS